MNAIRVLEGLIRQRFPDTKTKIDAPEQPSGPWFLDIEGYGSRITVEWRPERGFGITKSSSPCYGDGVDEVVSDANSATRRVLHLLTLMSPQVRIQSEPVA